MFYAFLLALQAAGMVVDYMGTKNQQGLMDLGSKVQQAGFEANLETTRLQAEDESLQAMKQLRANLGSQIAANAARGTAMGGGSALAGITESLSSFSSDERTRRINLLGKENQLRAGAAMARLQSMSESSKLWQGFASRIFSKIPTNPAAYGQLAQGFGLTQFTG